jgi:hypothetical protein
LDFWIDKDISSNWNYSGTQTKGGKVIYSDVAIEIAPTLSYLYSPHSGKLKVFSAASFSFTTTN